MGYENPPIPWSDLERALDGNSGATPVGDGGDSPAWTRHRPKYRAGHRSRAADDQGENRVPYAELHCHSNFSFLDGASSPEGLVAAAAAQQLDGIALTDHDGMYGVVRFAEAAREHGVRTLYGAELSLGLPAPQNGIPDPQGSHLLLLAKRNEGYTRLCRAITEAHLAGEGADPADPADPAQQAEKGKPVYHLDRLAAELDGHCVVLTGCRKGAVRQALSTEGPAAAARELRRLVDLFKADNVHVELTDHGLPEDDERNDLLAGMAAEYGLPTVATNAVHYATPREGRLAAAMAAVRARRSLDEMDGWLPPAPAAYVRSGEEMLARLGRYPGAVQRAASLGLQCQFDLELVRPELPPFRDLEGHDTEIDYLRHRAMAGARHHYGKPADNPEAYRRIEHELAIIEQQGFPGYFLIVADIVDFCRRKDILCQGRGSAATSAVCYALGITKVDAVRHKLLFERFLSPEREGAPDIDLDIESDRREEAIQYVYNKYGRRRAAQVANVITYRPKNAVRDMARALGYSPGQQDAWSKQIDHWGALRETADAADHDIPAEVLDLAAEIEGAPRHLGIHSGGMVLCDRPVSEVCPVEWARMENRSVVQWDKDDCAAAGLVKFDLLGLGMLSALHYMTDLVAEHHNETIDLAGLSLAEPEVYAMMQRADTIGVFQVESRAQMATLPRLKPQEFYDLVVEVALIRPGPIQGGSVHPYIRRKRARDNGEPDNWQHEHHLMEQALERTLGVPLFQEQMMQLAIDVAGFDAVTADELRRAIGSKRSAYRLEQLRDRLFAGMAKTSEITGELAESIYRKLLAFSNFGFPESHAFSFAHLVYSSAHVKYHYPAAFCAALLRAQPMGFYSPQSLVADARRHGVVVHGPDVNASGVHAGLEPHPTSTGGRAVRIGLATVRTIGEPLAETIVRERNNGPFRELADLAARTGLHTANLEALATAGAFDSLGLSRREALWAAAAAAAQRADRLPGTVVGATAPPLPAMDPIARAAADAWATGLSPDSFPTQFLRDQLDERGAIPAAELGNAEPGSRILVGGAVTHRQRPATAGGITFLNLEDETGMVNVICSPGLLLRERNVVRGSTALLVRGIVQSEEGVVSVLADHCEPLQLRIRHKSRDFR